MQSIGEILNWSLTASCIIALIFLINTIFNKHLSKTYQCALWMIVLVRLLIPSMPNSSVSLFNLLSKGEVAVNTESIVEKNNKIKLSLEEVEEGVVQAGKIEQQEKSNLNASIAADTLKEQENLGQEGKFLYAIWIIGAISVGAYFTYGYLRVSCKLRKLQPVTNKEILNLFEACKDKVKLPKKSLNISLVEGEMPMIFGVLRPTIAVPIHYKKEALETILLHELVHYKYKDYLLTYVQLIVLALHWFNPIVWFAMKQIKEDIEYACDERVIHLGVAKKIYAETLLEMVIPKTKENAFIQGMGDTNKQVKNRIIKVADLKKKKILGSVLSLLLVSVLTVGCLTDAKVNNNEKYVEGVENIVFFGMDQDGSHADCIMVASVNAEDGTIKVTSIPRDTKVVLDEAQKALLDKEGIVCPDVMKFSELLAYGGIQNIYQLPIKEIEKLLEVKVNHYMIVDLEEAAALVDDIGGIDVTVPEDMIYNDKEQGLYINLKAGFQHLNGDKAMQLARYRRYPEGALKRIEVMGTVAKSIIDKVFELSSIEKFREVVKGMQKMESTDLSFSDVTAYYKLLKKINLENVSFYILPGEATVEGGRSYYIADK